MITLKTNQSELKIFPELGGIPVELQLFNGKDKIQLLDSYKSESDEMAKIFYKSHFLLPFPNRLKDGKYTFEGQDYQFPINETSRGHNLHGFTEVIPMAIIQKEENENDAMLQLKGVFEGLPYYPFPFDFFLTYNLTSSELTIEVTIKNTGNSSMPFGFGWHPYFKLDTSKIDTLRMKFPDCQLVKIDNRMIPTGKTTAYSDFSNFNLIENKELDNCFVLNSEMEKATITLKSDTAELNIWQSSDMPYFQVYTPDTRASIAIEPMTCNIDAFNNKNGLWILKSGEEETISFGVELK